MREGVRVRLACWFNRRQVPRTSWVERGRGVRASCRIGRDGSGCPGLWFASGNVSPVFPLLLVFSPFLPLIPRPPVLPPPPLFLVSAFSFFAPRRAHYPGTGKKIRWQEVSTRLAKYDDCFVDAMVAEGVGSFATPLDEGGSIREGLVTFAAFALCGVLPLLAYALSPLISAAGGGDGPASQGTLFLWACLVTAAALFSIGVVKVCVPSDEQVWRPVSHETWASLCQVCRCLSLLCFGETRRVLSFWAGVDGFSLVSVI